MQIPNGRRRCGVRARVATNCRDGLNNIRYNIIINIMRALCGSH